MCCESCSFKPTSYDPCKHCGHVRKNHTEDRCTAYDTAGHYHTLTCICPGFELSRWQVESYRRKYARQIEEEEKQNGTDFCRL